MRVSEDVQCRAFVVLSIPEVRLHKFLFQHLLLGQQNHESARSVQITLDCKFKFQLEFFIFDVGIKNISTALASDCGIDLNLIHEFQCVSDCGVSNWSLMSRKIEGIVFPCLLRYFFRRLLLRHCILGK